MEAVDPARLARERRSLLFALLQSLRESGRELLLPPACDGSEAWLLDRIDALQVLDWARCGRGRLDVATCILWDSPARAEDVAAEGGDAAAGLPAEGAETSSAVPAPALSASAAKNAGAFAKHRLGGAVAGVVGGSREDDRGAPADGSPGGAHHANVSTSPLHAAAGHSPALGPLSATTPRGPEAFEPASPSGGRESVAFSPLTALAAAHASESRAEAADGATSFGPPRSPPAELASRLGPVPPPASALYPASLPLWLPPAELAAPAFVHETSKKGGGDAGDDGSCSSSLTLSSASPEAPLPLGDLRTECARVLYRPAGLAESSLASLSWHVFCDCAAEGVSAGLLAELRDQLGLAGEGLERGSTPPPAAASPPSSLASPRAASTGPLPLPRHLEGRAAADGGPGGLGPAVERLAALRRPAAGGERAFAEYVKRRDALAQVVWIGFAEAARDATAARTGTERTRAVAHAASRAHSSRMSQASQDPHPSRMPQASQDPHSSRVPQVLRDSSELPGPAAPASPRATGASAASASSRAAVVSAPRPSLHTLLAALGGALRRLDVRHESEYSPAEAAASGRALLDASRALAEALPHGWALPDGLRAAVAGRLLQAAFVEGKSPAGQRGSGAAGAAAGRGRTANAPSSFSSSSRVPSRTPSGYAPRCEELLATLASRVWPAAGVSEAQHLRLYAAAHAAVGLARKDPVTFESVARILTSQRAQIKLPSSSSDNGTTNGVANGSSKDTKVHAAPDKPTKDANGTAASAGASSAADGAPLATLVDPGATFALERLRLRLMALLHDYRSSLLPSQLFPPLMTVLKAVQRLDPGAWPESAVTLDVARAVWISADAEFRRRAETAIREVDAKLGWKPDLSGATTAGNGASNVSAPSNGAPASFSSPPRPPQGLASVRAARLVEEARGQIEREKRLYAPLLRSLAPSVDPAAEAAAALHESLGGRVLPWVAGAGGLGGGITDAVAKLEELESVLIDRVGDESTIVGWGAADRADETGISEEPTSEPLNASDAGSRRPASVAAGAPSPARLAAGAAAGEAPSFSLSASSARLALARSSHPTDRKRFTLTPWRLSDRLTPLLDAWAAERTTQLSSWVARILATDPDLSGGRGGSLGSAGGGEFAASAAGSSSHVRRGAFRAAFFRAKTGLKKAAKLAKAGVGTDGAIDADTSPPGRKGSHVSSGTLGLSRLSASSTASSATLGGSAAAEDRLARPPLIRACIEALQACEACVDAALELGVPLPAGAARLLADALSDAVARTADAVTDALPGPPQALRPQAPPPTRYKKADLDEAKVDELQTRLDGPGAGSSSSDARHRAGAFSPAGLTSSLTSSISSAAALSHARDARACDEGVWDPPPRSSRAHDLYAAPLPALVAAANTAQRLMDGVEDLQGRLAELQAHMALLTAKAPKKKTSAKPAQDATKPAQTAAGKETGTEPIAANKEAATTPIAANKEAATTPVAANKEAAATPIAAAASATSAAQTPWSSSASVSPGVAARMAAINARSPAGSPAPSPLAPIPARSASSASKQTRRPLFPSEGKAAATAPKVETNPFLVDDDEDDGASGSAEGPAPRAEGTNPFLVDLSSSEDDGGDDGDDTSYHKSAKAVARVNPPVAQGSSRATAVRAPSPEPSASSAAAPSSSSGARLAPISAPEPAAPADPLLDPASNPFAALPSWAVGALDGARASCRRLLAASAAAVGARVVWGPELREALCRDLWRFDASERRLGPVVLGLLDGALGDACACADGGQAARALAQAAAREMALALRFVVLDGGPARAFAQEDCKVVLQDVQELFEVFLADGDGLPLGDVLRALVPVLDVLPLLAASSDVLLTLPRAVHGPDAFATAQGIPRSVAEALATFETRTAAAPRGSLACPPMPPAAPPAHVVFQVLSHRADHAVSKVLKTMRVPKKLPGHASVSERAAHALGGITPNMGRLPGQGHVPAREASPQATAAARPTNPQSPARPRMAGLRGIRSVLPSETSDGSSDAKSSKNRSLPFFTRKG